jgi:hypothetical protein
MTDTPRPTEPLTAEELAFVRQQVETIREYERRAGRDAPGAEHVASRLLVTLDAALASSPAPAGLDELREDIAALERRNESLTNELIVAKRALASSPAPAGLDVERLADRIRALDEDSAKRLIDWRDLSPREIAELLAVRAATRPAETPREAKAAADRAMSSPAPAGSRDE